MKKLYVETLGCPKNRVDAEVFIGGFMAAGWKLVFDPSDADLIILNSCGFIESAREETIERFFDLYEQKTENAKIALTGCLPQLYPEISKELNEADYVLGIDAVAHMPDIIEKEWAKGMSSVETNPVFLYSSREKRVLSLSPYTAYVKIADGCDNCCTYCSIPLIRGHYRERMSYDVLAEIRDLVHDGVKEIVLIAQDTTQFGNTHGTNLQSLLSQIDDLDGDFRVRLMYLYPGRVAKEMLVMMKKSRKIMPYFEIPVQHISDSVLHAMNRHYVSADVFDLVEDIDEIFGDTAVLRTTLIVGFPAEKTGDFKKLEQFAKEALFDYIGMFPYSQEEVTAAAKMRRKPDSLIQKRIKQLEEIIAVETAKRLDRFIGQEIDILYEGYDESSMLCLGRGYQQAPEIDGQTIITNITDEKPGQWIRCRITARDEIDFIAEVI